MDNFFNVTDHDRERFSQMFSDVIKKQGQISINLLFAAAILLVMGIVWSSQNFCLAGQALSILFIISIFKNHIRQKKLFEDWREGKIPDRPYS